MSATVASMVNLQGSGGVHVVLVNHKASFPSNEQRQAVRGTSSSSTLFAQALHVEILSLKALFHALSLAVAG